MESYLISILDNALPDLLSQIVHGKFDVSLTMAASLVQKSVLPHLVRLKDSVKLIIVIYAKRMRFYVWGVNL